MVFRTETGVTLRRYDAAACSSRGYICLSLWVVAPVFTYLIVVEAQCCLFCRLSTNEHISILPKCTFDFYTFFCSSDITSLLAGLLNGDVHCLLDGIVVGCWVWFPPFIGLVARVSVQRLVLLVATYVILCGWLRLTSLTWSWLRRNVVCFDVCLKMNIYLFYPNIPSTFTPSSAFLILTPCWLDCLMETILEEQKKV